MLQPTLSVLLDHPQNIVSSTYHELFIVQTPTVQSYFAHTKKTKQKNIYYTLFYI
jgi:hypothetical protein